MIQRPKWSKVATLFKGSGYFAFRGKIAPCYFAIWRQNSPNSYFAANAKLAVSLMLTQTLTQSLTLILTLIPTLTLTQTKENVFPLFGLGLGFELGLGLGLGLGLELDFGLGFGLA